MGTRATLRPYQLYHIPRFPIPRIECNSRPVTTPPLRTGTPRESLRWFLSLARQVSVVLRPPLIFTPLTLCGGTTRPDTPTTLVACGWAGAVFELLEQLGRGSEAPDCENNIASHPRITHGHWSVIPNALFRVIK